MWGRGGGLFVNNNFFNYNRNYFPNRGNWGSEHSGNSNAGWRHNPRYRGGVPYPNRDVAKRYNGGRGGSLRPSQSSSNLGNGRPPGGGNYAGRGGNYRHGPAGTGQRPPQVGANRPGGYAGSAVAGRGPGVSPGYRGGAYGRGMAGQARPYRGANSIGMGGTLLSAAAGLTVEADTFVEAVDIVAAAIEAAGGSARRWRISAWQRLSWRRSQTINSGPCK
jgi:hypothetical protein